MGLNEWLSHHLSRGIEHFYLINDNSTDHYMDILQPFIEAHLVTLYHTPTEEPKFYGRQSYYYNHFFQQHFKECMWMAIIDIDEYLYSPVTLKVSSVLKYYEHYGQVTVNWVWFGSNGHDKQPLSIVEGFTTRAPFGFSKLSPIPGGKMMINGTAGPKGIANTQFTNSLSIHGHNTSEEAVNLSWGNDPNKPYLLINHYAIQSKEFWTTVKMTRGDADNWFNTEDRNMDYFNCWDINEIEDYTLINQNRELLQVPDNLWVSCEIPTNP